MFPTGVESKVEQYLNCARETPTRRNAFRAESDWVTASGAGMERVLSATTTASASPKSKSAAGGPIVKTTFIPPRTSIEPMSVAPVKSSAITPNAGPDMITQPCWATRRPKRMHPGCQRPAYPLPCAPLAWLIRYAARV